MLYAVIDWDNTVRRGFTLFDWMEYLYSRNVIDRKVNKEIEAIQDLYADKKISHDEYAKQACAIYAKAMDGISVEMRNRLVTRYMRYDEKQLQPFAPGLFSYLKRYGIKPIIISGAPEYILEHYTERFGIHKIYAFCEIIEHGRCIGSVKYNYGADKQKTVRLLCETYGRKPLIGFGDSNSDIPLFQMSQYP